MIAFQEIRNATVKLIFPHVAFLVDPWLQDECSEEEKAQALATRAFVEKPVCPLPFPAEEIVKDVDCFLVSHLHADHFTDDYLPKTAPFVFQSDAEADIARTRGYVNASTFHNDELTIGGVTVRRVDALHGDTPAMLEKAGPASGYIFTCDGEKTVYLAGDTIYCEQFESVVHQYKPDVIVVNACDAHGKFGRLIMNADDVMKTCELAPHALIIASHMDTVSHAHLTRAQLKAALAETPFAQRVLIPEDGEVVKL